MRDVEEAPAQLDTGAWRSAEELSELAGSVQEQEPRWIAASLAVAWAVAQAAGLAVALVVACAFLTKASVLASIAEGLDAALSYTAEAAGVAPPSSAVVFLGMKGIVGMLQGPSEALPGLLEAACLWEAPDLASFPPS